MTDNPTLSEILFIFSFISDLKPELQHMIQLRKPQTHNRAFEQTLLQEYFIVKMSRSVYFVGQSSQHSALVENLEHRELGNWSIYRPQPWKTHRRRMKQREQPPPVISLRSLFFQAPLQTQNYDGCRGVNCPWKVEASSKELITGEEDNTDMLSHLGYWGNICWQYFEK